MIVNVLGFKGTIKEIPDRSYYVLFENHPIICRHIAEQKGVTNFRWDLFLKNNGFNNFNSYCKFFPEFTNLKDLFLFIDFLNDTSQNTFINLISFI